MKHWKRSVSPVSHDLAEYLQGEIRRRWPEGEYPFHIEVIASQDTTWLEVRVWNAGVHIVNDACPMKFLASAAKSPTVAAVLHAIESG